MSDPVADRYASLIDTIRFKIGDTGTPPVFSDDRLKQEINAAILDHNDTYTIETLPESEDRLIVLLVWIQICYVLAGDSAKEISLTLDGMSIDKSKRVSSYLALVKQLKAEYAEAVTTDAPVTGSGDIVMGELYRTSIDTGRKVPYSVDPGLAPTHLNAPILNVNSVNLSWVKVLFDDFFRYELYRKSLSETDYTLVAMFYDAHSAAYTDSNLATGKHTYKLRIISKNELSADSNAQEVTVE